MTARLFEFEPNAAPVAVNERTARIADPGFGRVMTDHMAVARWSDAAGWHDLKITARAPFSLDPATSVLHYAQEIFEGLKAYRTPDGVALFRPEANAARFNRSARRMAMAELPEELFIASCRELVDVERDWIPDVEGGALYLRPFMIASEVFLGVKPATEYLYAVLATSVGIYWKGGLRAISLWVSHDYCRAGPGGTGDAKCGGNYAASLAAQRDAFARGHDQVVFLDATERRWIEECGGMNVFFVFDDGSIATPPLTGTILPGITRESLMQLARDEGIVVREEMYAIDQWRADAESGRLVEAFACGTAAVVTPIGRVSGPDYSFEIGGGAIGQTTARLLKRLSDLQRGAGADPHGWRHLVD